MAKQTISIKQGQSFTIQETVTGAESLEGYTAKMYIKTKDGTEVDTITGTIVGLVITYEALNEDTKVYPVDNHEFETWAFDASDHAEPISEGAFIVRRALTNDPS